MVKSMNGLEEEETHLKERCPSLHSIAAMNSMAKATWGRMGLFSSHVYIMVCH